MRTVLGEVYKFLVEAPFPWGETLRFCIGIEYS